MGNQDQLQGKLEQAGGEAKENVGDALDNEKLENEGRMDQAKGAAREGVGDVKEGVDKVADAWNKS